jgi:hypothetical protein
MHARSLKVIISADTRQSVSTAFHPQARLEVPDGAGLGELGFEAAAFLILNPEADVICGVANRVLGLIAEYPREGFVDLDEPMIIGGADRGRHRGETEGLGKPLLGMAQGRLSLPARLQVSECEQHATDVADLDRLACHHHLAPARIARHRETGFHLRNGFARAQPLEGKVPTVGPFKDINLIDGSAQHVLAVVPGELQETLVHLDQAQVREATDGGGRRVGRKGPLEALLGLDLFADVVNNENQTIRIARMISDNKAANAVGAIPILVGFVGHHNHDIVEGLTGHDTVDGVAAMFEQIAALMPQDEVVAVFVNSSAEFVKGRDSVHRQRGLVGVGNGLVRLDQDHALG